MKKYSKILALILTFILTFSFATLTLADVGNFESYDSDWGGSDWGGSDWGSSSWDSDWGSSDYDSSSSGEDNGFFVLIVIVIIIIVALSQNKNKPSGPSNYNTRTNNNNSNNNNASRYSSQKVLEDIKAIDEFFNEDKFLSSAKNTFVKLQECWTKRNWEEIRTFETEELFEQHSTQLKQYIEKKQINVMDRIAVNYANLYSFSQDNDKDTLKILLNSSMIDYIKDEETGKILKGDATTRRTTTYLMTFIRKKGLKTQESNGEMKTSNCPNCGAPTNVTSSGKCEYCGAIITKGDHDWVLSNLEPFRG